MAKIKRIGVLTAGGDCPGLNAAIRAVGKSALSRHGIEVIGIRDGFRGLIEDHMLALNKQTLANILTVGGTILGTSRIRPHAYETEDGVRDATGDILKAVRRNRIDALVCIGGGGTHKNAFRLVKKGLRVVTIPKTIDNDVAQTDTSIGFDTAISIATEAVDRLHSTAHSHHRIIVAEIMGHRAGWLALGAGVAGGADVILLPEIPYDVERIARAIQHRSRRGLNFSIVAVAEGALSRKDAALFAAARGRKEKARTESARDRAADYLAELDRLHRGNTQRLAQQLEELTGLESRLSILGYVQRGGAPTSTDRLLATRLGNACAELVAGGKFGVMVAARGDDTVPVPIEKVAGKRKQVPLDHSWIRAARAVGTCLGD